jgi:hypothetical protein
MLAPGAPVNGLLGTERNRDMKTRSLLVLLLLAVLSCGSHVKAEPAEPARPAPKVFTDQGSFLRAARLDDRRPGGYEGPGRGGMKGPIGAWLPWEVRS